MREKFASKGNPNGYIKKYLFKFLNLLTLILVIYYGYILVF